jgi:hypothetical protein
LQSKQNRHCKANKSVIAKQTKPSLQSKQNRHCEQGVALRGNLNIRIILKTILTLISLFYAIQAQADCTFNITNYSDTPIMVKAGFYNGPEADGAVNIASSRIIKIKNILSCNSTSNIGFGVTYVNLVGGKSEGGWVYTPSTKMIRAIGQSRISKDMVSGTAPNGEKLVLFNNARPGSNSFDVSVEKAGRNISRQLGSMN